ncbi:PT domain-containing protein [Streptomyces sp. NPDC020965]|uniref:PT domain-containing protein n=1 Tax=Streptomyces sp. NPDC020965 TaxID=3365105 RepID=UPI00378E5E0E
MIAETICSAVSAAGLGIAAITAYRKRFLAATRIAAYSLVPIGLVLTGAVEWAVDTAFSPTAWAGFGLLGGAWLLFMTTRAVERRTGGGRKERKAAKAAQREAVAPAASAPSLGGTRPAAQPTVKPAAQPVAPPSAKPKAARSGEDFSDIEAILKKHGI